jgi:hypothetical protein
LSRPRLEALEESGPPPGSVDLLVVLVWLVTARVEIDEAEQKAALRRAMLVLAAGGDPHRELDLDSVAAERLAAELDTPARRALLATALAALAADAHGLAAVAAALGTLQDDPDLAWRTLALALLADEISDE